MSKEVLDILERIGAERNISVQSLHASLEDAMIAASRKVLGPYFNVTRCSVDPATGQFRVFASKQVVDRVEEDEIEISLAEARKLCPTCQIGDDVEVDVTPENFGRIAAQNAKQVLTQRIRELEREMIYERYKDRVGELVSGTVQRYDRGNVIVDLGSAEALLPPSEQAFGEKYHYGDKLRAVIIEVKRGARDQQLILSRRTPRLVELLFAHEVNEIREGIVTIRRVAREAGKRSKIAVVSNDSSVDPVGSCVGIKGSRVQMVVQELRGERIDIIEYSSDLRRFVQNSLKPAEVANVEILDNKRALVIVREEMLSLAIGKQGLNAKLASELTGVEVDVVSDREYQEQETAIKRGLMVIEEITEPIADQLIAGGVFSVEDLLAIDSPETLTQVPGIDLETAQVILDKAAAIVAQEGAVAAEAEGNGSDEEFADSEVESSPGDETTEPVAGR